MLHVVVFYSKVEFEEKKKYLEFYLFPDIHLIRKKLAYTKKKKKRELEELIFEYIWREVEGISIEEAHKVNIF